MTPALETYLAEVEAAEGRMTGGTWEANNSWLWSPMGMVAYLNSIEVRGEFETEQQHANAHGIALLRNRAKALCGMVRGLVEALEADAESSHLYQVAWDVNDQADGDDSANTPGGSLAVTAAFDLAKASAQRAETLKANALAAVALIAKGQGEGEGNLNQGNTENP